MEFQSHKGIFLQIADTICNQILEGKLIADSRIPSVRELAVEIEVNRNTVMRSYSYLQDEKILENKRGVGFFVTGKAKELILKKEKRMFLEKEQMFILEKIRLLKLNSKDLYALLEEIKKND
jgi:DNA-binding transcriptional regulator YhcF (GntR family)